VELLRAIEQYYQQHGVVYERVTFAFKGPKNIGLISEPPGNRDGTSCDPDAD
jgi:hypothetical protein